jgi:hypothetical protein
MARGFTVVTFRKGYDRAKLIARYKEESAKAKDEFGEKNGVVRQVTKEPVKRTKTIDLSDPRRIVVLNDLPDSSLNPSADAPVGLHADTIRTGMTVPFVAGVNLNALPDEIRGESLPAEVRPFQPILKAESVSVVGTVAGGKIDLSVRVRSKEKTNAAEVEKSLDALRTFLMLGIPSVKKAVEKETTGGREFVKLLGAADAALKDAKFTLSEKVATVAVSVPADLPFGVVLDFLTGGRLSERTVSANNLKQLALSVYNYESAHGHYPVAVTLGRKGKKLLSWRVEILPYVEQEALYKKFHLDEPWDSEHNLKVFQENPMPKVFALPGSKSAAEKKTHYQVFVNNGAMFDTATVFKVTDIKDGTSNTFMIATAATPVEWTRPDDVEFDPKGEVKKLLLFQNGSSLVAMGDGSVRTLSDMIAEKTLKAAVTRDGGETLGDDF